MEEAPDRPHVPPVAIWAALGLLVFSSRLWLIQSAGSDLPFWDQWDAEAQNLYLPWMSGSLRWRDLFAGHNEHRIVLTRLADLALFAVDGKWEPMRQLILNAALHATTAIAIAAFFWRKLEGAYRGALIVGLAVLFTATCGWQNALWGFQSQVYFTNLLAVVGIGGLTAGRAWTTRWSWGLAAALLVLGANASGVFVAAAALPLLLRRCCGRSAILQDRLATAAVLVVVLAGYALRVESPHHDMLHAASIAQFSAVFAHCLSWPFVDHVWPVALTQLPLLWLAVRNWRQRTTPTACEAGAFALGLFAVLHAAAIAYGRGAGLPEQRPLSRYQDPLLLGAAAQFFAALRLAAGGTRIERLALLAWSALIAAGLITLTTTNLSLHLPYKRLQDQRALSAVHRYLEENQRGNANYDGELRALHPTRPAAVRDALDEPSLRDALSAALRHRATSMWLVRSGFELTCASAVLLIAVLLAGARRPPSTSR